MTFISSEETRFKMNEYVARDVCSGVLGKFKSLL